MKIVFAASEIVPFSKTGGLADMLGSLTGAIQALGHDVVVFTPRYRSVDASKLGLEPLQNLEFKIGHDKAQGRLFRTVLKAGPQVYFIDHPEFFGREGLYGDAHGDYPDNDRRFVFFQRAILESLKAINFKPDVIHCHDWQTGLIPVYLKSLYAKDAFFQKVKTVFTIHNLGYQGNFPPDSLPGTGLDWDQFRLERLEFYGKVSFLKGGLVDADALTTVSERYAREIQTKEFGCGMEGVLGRRTSTLYGIVNGIDPEDWNPEKDAEISAHFSASKPEKKAVNKAAVQKEHGLQVQEKKPLIAVISRLVDHKGIDILMPAIPVLMQMGFQLVVIGTGEERYHHMLREAAKKNKGSLAVHILFDPKMAKRLYAGADMVLMPSYYEPCGLGQMIAMRYGTIPVVRATGGLADTVDDFDVKSGKGNGFSFEEYTPGALAAAMERALAVYRNEKKWHELMMNAMQCDFSWTASAKKYVQIYEMSKRRPVEGMEKK